MQQEHISKLDLEPEFVKLITTAFLRGNRILLLRDSQVGTTLIARRLITLLPELTEDEKLDIVATQALGRILPENKNSIQRPLRAPHWAISDWGMGGSDSPFSLGEIHLAGHGVLLLSEVTQFYTSSLRKASPDNVPLSPWGTPANYRLVATAGYGTDTKYLDKIIEILGIDLCVEDPGVEIELP